MPNLTQLGSNLFVGHTYSLVIHTGQDGQTWVAHHTDKTRQYRTDWSAEKVAQAIEGTKNLQSQLDSARKTGLQSGKVNANHEHNKLPWWKRIKKK